MIGTWGMLSDLQLSTADRDYDACVGDLVEAGAVPVGEDEIAWYDPGGAPGAALLFGQLEGPGRRGEARKRLPLSLRCSARSCATDHELLWAVRKKP